MKLFQVYCYSETLIKLTLGLTTMNEFRSGYTLYYYEGGKKVNMDWNIIWKKDQSNEVYNKLLYKNIGMGKRLLLILQE